jgi:hypothetical protein
MTAAANTPRFDHNPVTGESLGFLVEEQRTNLLLRSQEFDDAGWFKNGATVTTNTVVSPDGTLTADKLVEDTATSLHRTYYQLATTAGAHTFSLYAKKAEREWLVLILFDNSGTSPSVYFNLSTGVVGNTSNATGTITSVGNGWYRCTITATIGASGASGAQVYLTTANGGPVTYTGDGTSGIYIWGAQLEAASTVGPYIKTVATAITTPYAAPIESPNGLAFPLLSSMTPARNSDMTFELASNTSLVVKVRGSDGTVRSATLTLA